MCKWYVLVARRTVRLMVTAALLCALTRLANAANFVVTSTGDTTNANDGVLTLREAIAASHNLSHSNTITFDPTVFAARRTITLTGGELSVSNNATIIGPSYGVVIDANNASRVLNMASGSLDLSNLEITNGKVSGNGGGILISSGTLTLTNCTLDDNSADLSGQGGGLASTGGTVTLTNCTVASNQAGNGGTGGGGGLFNDTGTMSLVNCTVAGNSDTNGAGGVLGNSGRVTLTSTLIALNTAPANTGTPDLDISTFTSNGYNLIGDGQFTGPYVSTDQVGTDATHLLDPKLELTGSRPLLKDNGGSTPTVKLLTGSPAIDKGKSSLTTDQRGKPRPFDANTIAPAAGGDNSDIGAYEVQDATAQSAFGQLIVNTTLDDDDGTCGPGGADDCTLREAINAATLETQITFDPTVFGTSRQTIALTKGPLLVNGNLSIRGPSLGVTISGSHANPGFEVFGGKSAFTNLSIINGQSDDRGSGPGIGGGGGILVDGISTALTLNNCSFSGNSATVRGGALFCLTDSKDAVTLTNCTLSGNSAPSAGGIFVFDGNLTLNNCTVSGNTAANGGGGLVNGSGIVTVASTLFALNSAPGSPDVAATVVSNGYNLIGQSDGSSGFTAATDRKGTVANPLNPGLDPSGLRDNGGPVPTIALLRGSPAVDQGSSTSGTDARGLPRPFDLATVANAAGGDGSDIGAFELQLPVLDLNGPATGLNNNVTFTEKSGGVRLLSSTATLADNSSGTLAAATITLDATPDGGSETLTANTAGTALSAAYNAATRTLGITGTDTLAHYLQVLATITYNNTSQDPTVTPRLATFTVSDGANTNQLVTTTIAVVPVNDPPTFTAAGNVTVAEDSGAYSQPWASSISPVEAGQTVTITSSNTNAALFSAQPSLAANGTLGFTPAPDANGVSTVTVQFKDNGGTANGGQDTTTATFTITVTPVNDAPVANSQSVSTVEDTPVAITLAATDIDSLNLTYAVVTPPAHGTLSGTGANLTYTPAANYNGADSFTFKANDGALDSNIATVTIAIGSVNDAPVAQADAYPVTGLLPLTVAAPGVLSNDTDADGDALHAVVVTAPAHGSLTLNADGSFIYTPTIGYNGADAFTYKANDGALDSNIATVTLTISGNLSRTLRLTLSSTSVKEGTPVTATLTLSRPSSTPTTATLLSSQTKVATVPAHVIVAVGQTSATFTVATLKNPLATGSLMATISANNTDYGTASANLTVTDNETPTLTLMVVPAAINENYGPAAAVATVARNTPTVQALRVTILNSNIKAVKVPASIIIPAGASAVSFFVAALDNRIVNKAQSALLTAHLTGYKDGTAKLTVADNGKVTRDLKLTLDAGLTYTERGGGQIATGQVTLLGAPLTKNLTITLVSSDPKRISLPATVLLRAGQTHVSFGFRILDNTVADGPHSVWLTARALTYGTSAVLVTVQDNDGPILSLSLPKTSVAENSGSLTATVTRLHVPTTASLVVSLASSDHTRVTVPATVTIPAGHPSATFKVTIINNSVVDGNHTITLTASKAALVPGTATLQVLDDDHPAAVTPRSAVVLSGAAVSAIGAIRLRFTGALDAATAEDAARYTVTVNGQAVAVASLAYDATTHTVTLALPDGTTGSAVVSWQDLRDTQDDAVSGTFGPLAVR